MDVGFPEIVSQILWLFILVALVVGVFGFCDLTPELVASLTRVRSLLQHTPLGYFLSTSCAV